MVKWLLTLLGRTIQIVRPSLHHFTAFWQVLRVIVCGSGAPRFCVRSSSNHIRLDWQQFSQFCHVGDFAGVPKRKNANVMD